MDGWGRARERAIRHDSVGDGVRNKPDAERESELELELAGVGRYRYRTALRPPSLSSTSFLPSFVHPSIHPSLFHRIEPSHLFSFPNRTPTRP